VSSAVGRVLVSLLGAALLAVAVTALVSPRPVFTHYHQPVVVALSVTLAAAALWWRPGAVVRRCCRWRWTALLVTGVAGAVAMVTGHALRLPYSWDMGGVLRIAERLHRGVELSDYQQGYVARYPNNTAILAVDRAAYAASDATGWETGGILITLGVAGATLTVWMVHQMVLPLGGAVRAVAAQLVTAVLVAASPWMAIPYTDVLAMPFLCGGLLLAMRAMQRRDDRWALPLACAAGAGVALAGVMKTTPYVVVVALLVTGALATAAARRHRRVATRWAVGTLAALAALAGTVLTASTAVDASIADVPPRRETSAPVLWWVANGMTQREVPAQRRTSYGGYNGAMVRAIAGKTPEEARQWSADWIREQWAGRGVGGTAEFYAKKAAWNWGDGMFGVWAEGQDGKPERLPPGEGFVGWVRSLDRPDGRWYAQRSDVTQAVWVALLVVTGLGALRARRPSPEVLLLTLSVLGVAAFTLLFQGRARYLFTFVPLVAALAGLLAPRPRSPLLGWRAARADRADAGRDGAAQRTP
jgi:hypothetical protein